MSLPKLIAVDCPKCDGKMVPLSSAISPMTGKVEVMPFAEWRCVKCGYSVSKTIERL